ncbi:DUF6168 family protein [Altibacter sp.]|uniref:DUF6168 family protein n=1 Tax=Altibacter sp. TaxID=2024823 RepID=UPI0025859504|nr:DUF6168 family protein [Altibacter sp.]MCW8980332.1 DUF6168 family protein [Altibacter sp.]MCW9036890.1 DUF6168 family protein [Altibacter sp.]
MTGKGIVFLGVLFVLLLIAFFIHIGLLNYLDLPLFEARIIPSYLINFALAAIILWLVKSNLNKKSSYTGFIFMLGSGIKFLVFFLFFYPYYQQDDTMGRVEFAAFFVPYALCLISEVYYLSKLLNNQSYSD